MPSLRIRMLLTTPLLAALLCAFSLLLCCERAFALDPDKAFAHYISNSWSIQDGLPQITALAIAQDRTGYIWVGTQAGLARFDGVHFTTFTPDNEPGLPGIFIRALLVDRSGRLWIGTYKGLAVYADGHFRTLHAGSQHPTPDINALAQTADGDIVAATSDGVFEISGNNLIELPNGPKPALSLLPRADGLWVGDTGAVLRLDGSHRIDAHALSMPLPAQAASAAVVQLVAAQGRIWAGTTQGLYSRIGDAWVRFEEGTTLGNSPIGTIVHDHDDNLWVSTNSGFARLRNAHLVEWIGEDNPRAIKSVISAFEDREHNLWLGSQLEGLARYWNGWTRRYGVYDGLNNRIVWSLSHAPDGSIWVGTNDGLSKFDGKRFSLVVPGSALPHPHGYNLLAETDQVWIGTRRGLAIWRDGKLQTPTLYAPMASVQINGIWRDGNGDLWFPTTNGLFIQHAENLRRYGQAEGIADARVRQVMQTRDHRILLGTQGGLYEQRGERFVQIGQDAGLPPGLDITAMRELPSGEIAIGTLSEQFYVYDGHAWTRFGAAQGIPSNAAFFITPDDEGYLWIAGIRGVSRVPMADFARFRRGQIHSVRGEMLLNERGDPNSGQQGFCCNGAGLSKGYIDGHVLWLPSRDGVVALDTHGIVKNTVTPTVVIERVRYLGAWHTVENPPAHVELDPHARDLAFDFAAPSFQDPRSILMRYRLLGYDRDWHDLDDINRRSVNYTNLPPGDYTFEVMAANNAGIWSPVIARYKFDIRRYFHETALFYGLAGLLLALLIYAGHRREQQVHAAQRALLEQQVRERTGQLHSANERLENASQTDPLTGLRNRRYLANQIPTDLAFYDREQLRSGNYDQSILFALVNIDHFKQINDKHGHKAGDRVLQQFAHTLSTLLRREDYVARWGGDEFLLVLRPMPTRHLHALGERVRAAIAMHAFDSGNDTPLHLTCSLGIADYPLFHDAQRRLGWEQVVELAEAALRWAKNNGRDCWVAFHPSAMVDVTTLMRELKVDPRKLIEDGQLQVFGSHIAVR